ncbi:MAG: lauroyl acyltransferase, partial [Proteobacteria bacterium]|nr:lauroyl acyltransferase [Pseudomonadota bacterium]
QQPRLRSGVFVPFFKVDALTTLVLPYLLRESHAALVFGIALREDPGFRLYLHRCDYDAAADDKTMLLNINRQFEEIVSANRDQYRWSDKRFNIRPKGGEKLYCF